jgi:hypothetical protein
MSDPSAMAHQWHIRRRSSASGTIHRFEKPSAGDGSPATRVSDATRPEVPRASGQNPREARPSSAPLADLRIPVSVAFEETLARARIRELTPLRPAEMVEQRLRSPYQPSQQHYSDTIRPTDVAHIVVRDEEPERPASDVVDPLEG